MKPVVKSTLVKICHMQRICFITTAFQLCFRICHQEGSRKWGRTGNE